MHTHSQRGLYVFVINTQRKTQMTNKLLLDYTRKELLDTLPYSTETITTHTYMRIARSVDLEWSHVVLGLNTRLTEARKRARIKGHACSITLRDLAKLWIDQQGLCAITGVEMQFESGTVSVRNPLACSFDRRRNSQGYTADNVQLVTMWANNAKGAWTDSLFESMIKSSYQRMSKSQD